MLIGLALSAYDLMNQFSMVHYNPKKNIYLKFGTLEYEAQILLIIGINNDTPKTFEVKHQN